LGQGHARKNGENIEKMESKNRPKGLRLLGKKKAPLYIEQEGVEGDSS